MKITKRQLRRIIRESLPVPGLRLGQEDFGKVGQPGWSWRVFTAGAWQDVTLTDDEKKSVDSMLDLDVVEEDLVIEVLEQSDIAEFDKELIGNADYFIVVDEDMCKTH